MATANVQAYIAPSAVGVNPETRNLLRFTTAGSVDDGKSTLIGRLLYDSQSVYEDQLASVRSSRINRSHGPVDFSLLTDGLRAEREQGITIDVAYRYFSTPRRKFIIADTPGHEQYTRNMATGASTAQAAIVLVDATKGVLPQSRRHAHIASLLGIQHVVAAVNKMDLVNFDPAVFANIAAEFQRMAETLGFKSIYALPISAVDGDNVVRRSARSSWFDGPALLEYLEELEPDAAASHDGGVRFPVQYVIRPDGGFRGFAGQVISGVLRPGTPVVALPSGATTRVRSIVTYDGELEEAAAGSAVTLTLENELDISRGDILTSIEKQPHVSRRFKATLVWMHATPLEPGAYYLLKHTARTVRARVTKLDHRVDVNTFTQIPAANLNMNDIASVELESALPLFFDPYRQQRSMGSFILIDPLSHATVAAGMIQGPAEQPDSSYVRGLETTLAAVTAEDRRQRFGHGPACVWITARPRVAELVERVLFDQGWHVQRIDQELETQELAAVARAFRNAGAVTVFSLPSPPAEATNELHELFGANAFFSSGDQGTDHEAASDIIQQLRGWKELHGQRSHGQERHSQENDWRDTAARKRSERQ
jgi:bifunctional enzyme CysN/CysC/sulfate adenylyltransferase subunit 1